MKTAGKRETSQTFNRDYLSVPKYMYPAWDKT